MPTVFERHRVIDTDTHITDPPDLWTSRVPARWAERVPRVERVGRQGRFLGEPELMGEAFGQPVLYEADYPHPTCMAPNEATHPRRCAESALGDVSDDVLARVLHDNAAALYGLG